MCSHPSISCDQWNLWVSHQTLQCTTITYTEGGWRLTEASHESFGSTTDTNYIRSDVDLWCWLNSGHFRCVFVCSLVCFTVLHNTHWTSRLSWKCPQQYMQCVLALTREHYWEIRTSLQPVASLLYDYKEGKWLDPSLMYSFFHDAIFCGNIMQGTH